MASADGGGMIDDFTMQFRELDALNYGIIGLFLSISSSDWCSLDA